MTTHYYYYYYKCLALLFFQKMSVTDKNHRSQHWLCDAVHIGSILYILSLPSVKFALWLMVSRLSRRYRIQVVIVWLMRVVLFAQLLKLSRTIDDKIGLSKG